eukprot:CAMPEP_0179367486 /NCGR_PEP_ID=MMETSP0797-20121207/83599_1 /TAXON_ID=47934 /ORGANISM="Dinophysis acuminata, Strain DAEP01" /LENGTH=387 /DNA_ID=CAMNT_0021083037 /DNA_START=29 /DNA_END=1190 /DNA_ORIENTATION=-
MKDAGPLFGPCNSTCSTNSGPSSVGDMSPLSPGSGGSCKGRLSMLRLPDEAPKSLLSKEQPWWSQLVISGAGAVGAAARPTSAHRRQAGVVSPAGCASRPGSGSQAGLAGLVARRGAALADPAAGRSPRRRALRRRQPARGEPPGQDEQDPQDHHGRPAGAADAPGRQALRALQDHENIHDLYEFEDQIEGGAPKSKVMVARRAHDNTEVVIKIRRKQPHTPSEKIWRAVMCRLLGMGKNRYVLDILEIIEDANDYYVVMPRCRGGELFDFLATETEIPESECKRILREILIAVGHLHKNNIIHRDVKPENIMFDLLNSGARAAHKTVKLIDFDTCLEWFPTTPQSSCFAGTPGYIAPEALMGQTSPQSDLWSIGVILYILMTGEMP